MVLHLLGVYIAFLACGVMALGLIGGQEGAEVVSGVFNSVGREQNEAGIALNFPSWQRTRHIILPQAFVIMLPTFGNNAIELLKATSVVSLISLADLTFQAQVVRAQTGSTLVPFLAVLILYYAMALSISWAMRLLERRVTRGLDGVRT